MGLTTVRGVFISGDKSRHNDDEAEKNGFPDSACSNRVEESNNPVIGRRDSRVRDQSAT